MGAILEHGAAIPLGGLILDWRDVPDFCRRIGLLPHRGWRADCRNGGDDERGGWDWRDFPISRLDLYLTSSTTTLTPYSLDRCPLTIGRGAGRGPCPVPQRPFVFG